MRSRAQKTQRSPTKKKATHLFFLLRHFFLIVSIAVEDKAGIEDRTETNLVNLRRIIYLTIMNALNYEEAVHKLLKIQIKEGQEVWVDETFVGDDTLIRYWYRLNS